MWDGSLVNKWNIVNVGKSPVYKWNNTLQSICLSYSDRRREGKSRWDERPDRNVPRASWKRGRGFQRASGSARFRGIKTLTQLSTTQERRRRRKRKTPLVRFQCSPTLQRGVPTQKAWKLASRNFWNQETHFALLMALKPAICKTSAN